MAWFPIMKIGMDAAMKAAMEVPELAARCLASTSGIHELGEAETDTIRKRGKLYLLKRAVEGVSINRQVDSNSSSLVNHWALVLHYEREGYWLVIEGGVDKSNSDELIPSYTKSFSRPVGELSEFNSMMSKLFDVVDKMPIPVLEIFQLNSFSPIPIDTMAKRGLPYIDCLDISPAEFQDVARNVLYNNNKYILALYDCQTWAKEAARMLTKYKA